MDGRVEKQMLHYMPAVTADAVNHDLLTADLSQQPAADADDINLSSATKRAMLLSRIHSRRFRE